MDIKPYSWNIIPDQFNKQSILLNQTYKISLYPYWQQIQFYFYGQLKYSDSGYILELNPREGNQYHLHDQIPVTLMTWYDYDMRFNFKSTESYTLLLDYENEVDAHKEIIPYSYTAILR